MASVAWLPITRRLQRPALGVRRLSTAVALHKQTYEGPGHRSPLVLLHGMFGAGGNFRSLGQRFAKERTVILGDLRNHGKSPWADDASLSAMSLDVTRMLSEVGRPVALCGHSLGGKVAMQVALQHPELIERLCVVDIAPVHYAMEGNRDIIAECLALPEDALADRKAADAALLAAAVRAEALRLPFVRQFLLNSLVPSERRWRINLRALLDSYDGLRRFDVPPGVVAPDDLPALFIGGEREGMLDRSNWPECLARFPAASLEMLPTGHWVHAEAPDRFFDVVSSFLEES